MTLRDEANPVHVLHFIGHGQFDPAAQEGMILFESETGAPDPVPAEALAWFLKNLPPRLIFLNACEGATTASSNIFSGTAQKLAQRSIPLVVAMQSKVADQDAVRRASVFYQVLAEGWPVDAALAKARKAVAADRRIAWGLPVLFMRTDNGHLFDITQHYSSDLPGALAYNQFTQSLLAASNRQNR
jgi:CHAT domain-containing protein